MVGGFDLLEFLVVRGFVLCLLLFLCGWVKV